MFFVENERESRLYTMNSHQFSLVLLNIIAASSCFGLETIEFSRVLFLSCMSNQANSVKSIYLPPLKYRNSSIFMIEVCRKNKSYIVSIIILAAPWENQHSAYAKTRAQISFAVTAKLISSFVFATRIVKFLFFLNPKFPACFDLWLYRLVCARPDRKLLGFSCSSYYTLMIRGFQQ